MIIGIAPFWPIGTFLIYTKIIRLLINKRKVNLSKSLSQSQPLSTMNAREEITNNYE